MLFKYILIAFTLSYSATNISVSPSEYCYLCCATGTFQCKCIKYECLEKFHTIQNFNIEPEQPEEEEEETEQGDS